MLIQTINMEAEEEEEKEDIVQKIKVSFLTVNIFNNKHLFINKIKIMK